MFTGHFANWEALSSAASAGGIPMRISYRRANNPYMDERIVKNREGMGVHTYAAKGDGNRELIKALKQGETLAILWDQRDNAGVEAPFFGHMVRTASGPVRLALAHNGVLIGVGMRRLKGANFTSKAYEPIELERTGNRQRDIELGVAQVNAWVEARIREAPEQWLWAHRRWPVEVYGELKRKKKKQARAPGRRPAASGRGCGPATSAASTGAGRWRGPPCRRRRCAGPGAPSGPPARRRATGVDIG